MGTEDTTHNFCVSPTLNASSMRSWLRSCCAEGRMAGYAQSQITLPCSTGITYVEIEHSFDHASQRRAVPFG